MRSSRRNNSSSDAPTGPCYGPCASHSSRRLSPPRARADASTTRTAPISWLARGLELISDGFQSARPEGRESSRIVEVMEEPRDTTLFDGHDHDLVRVEAALSALREEAVHDHGVPWALRDVEAVLAERTPRSGGEFVYLPSQRGDALWATVCSRK